ncbi:chaperone protein dnaJ 20, chloroplastic-like [Rutidosis leptorrhynchoides]|uniref:chaperone protein dnaJ 20, chloroplastic-like n=1 Tax=Rutidosis leptorrhynchoides TaxID=125765 RepID=UPI003A9963EF
MCCCNNGFISRIPTTTPPSILIPKTHFPIPSSFQPTSKIKSFRPVVTAAAVKDGGGSVSQTVVEDLSFYELLGIPETVTVLEIKQAYKQLARKYHPDVSPPGRVDEYTQRFIRVQEAYETLSDPNRRALYDRDMAMGIHFGFNSRSHQRNDEKMAKSEWRGQWQSQLSGLRRRSMYKESSKNTSWAARMRKQSDASPS